MTPEELTKIAEQIVNNNALPWWNYALVIALSFIGGYLGSFIKKKGEIAATKKYTQELQKTTHQNQLLLENHKAHSSLRMAAIDKRLQVHQEAYTLWKKLLSAIHEETIGSVVMECQSWWDKNCLYLSVESREAFRIAYQCAFDHKGLLNVPPNMQNQELIKSNFKNITDVGEIIVCSVELPSLGEYEQSNVVNK